MFDPRGRPRVDNGAYIVEIDRIVIRYVQYQFEVNWCRNEEFIVKGNFGWAWSMWATAPQVKIDLNRCRNEEFIVKGNFGWAWSMWAGRPRIDHIVIRDVQYQFEVNRCRNEEVNIKIPNSSSANSVGGDSGQDGRTDGRTAEITTISPRFSKSVGKIKTLDDGK
ncbi:hypothetical protein DPMN_085229 [Dreissena polymorpha]|uniref:Uncharacterized protein n=1 Tax=Dreissena polymorpha TaxID=45954 RepID=A0A9D4BJ85_DREPO|nr:hypothetical protein DPMN_085229 [Dreissena polymorpha]